LPPPGGCALRAAFGSLSPEFPLLRLPGRFLIVAAPLCWGVIAAKSPRLALLPSEMRPSAAHRVIFFLLLKTFAGIREPHDVVFHRSRFLNLILWAVLPLVTLVSCRAGEKASAIVVFDLSEELATLDA